jgi:hypothetical protein
MNIPYEIILYIFKFLYNEDVFKINKLCKDLKYISYNKIFIDEIRYRNHPLVFNCIDNYCKLCNTSPTLLNLDMNIIRCTHSIF